MASMENIKVEVIVILWAFSKMVYQDGLAVSLTEPSKKLHNSGPIVELTIAAIDAVIQALYAILVWEYFLKI